MATHNMRERRLVWIDLEMTGLRPDEGDCIIEIATIVTEGDLSLVAEGPVLAVAPSDLSRSTAASTTRRMSGATAT